MKKALSLVLTLLMVVCMCVPSFAAPGRFITSPSGVKCPIIIEFINSNDACTGKVVITAFADRHTLDDATRQQMEKAYNDIVNATDLANLNADLAALAKSLKIDSDKLAVSDLFDLSYVGCSEHEGHGYFTVTLKPETLKNFVGLLHLKGDNWELVKDAKVKGDTITFTAEEFSPFAIVVDTSAGSPVTGDFSNIGFYAVVMVVSAVALILIVFKLKKRETN